MTEYMTNDWDFKILDAEQKKLGDIYRNVNNIIISIVGQKGMEDSANLIIDGIWLGNYSAADSTAFVIENKIKYIINATPKSLIKFPFIEYRFLPMSDNNDYDENFICMIREGASIIDKAVTENASILIHCKRGHHRSASIVAYYLMAYKNMSLIDSIILIKKNRPTALRRISCTLKTLIICEHQNFHHLNNHHN